MADFTGIRFSGSFRAYQQRILDHADRHLADGHIHIVAAPGSGKTILGLELIRRLQAPCLILSPTTTIKYQWGDRFSAFFLPKGADPAAYISYDLRRVALMTSVTYQAIYSAMKRLPCADDNETVDYADIDLFQLIRDNGIRTICLDEAHHLQNEWQKALEAFMAGLGGTVTTVALTATPPYDAGKAEWDRYIAVCGEIDEEIFVPELVREGTLCPHQDYVYFNFPAQAETDAFRAYAAKTQAALEELYTLPLLSRAYAAVAARAYDTLFADAGGCIALLILCQAAGIAVDRRLIRVLTDTRALPRLTPVFAEKAVAFLLTDDTLLSDADREALRELLRRHGVWDNGGACFTLSDRLKRRLCASAGKLDSIAHIAAAESAQLGERLRMLILTDYIRRESLGAIGTAQPFDRISLVSVFETVRRTLPDTPIGAVSGSLILLPCAVVPAAWADTAVPLGQTGYAACHPGGGSRERVDCLTRLLQSGQIRILCGTRALLGEGWDSPCVNTLILASFVGSFMLSNQMRGRAIRRDPAAPGKVSNIWHLVTAEPDYLFADNGAQRLAAYLQHDPGTLVSDDFDTLSRRFSCFVGPHFDTGAIEDGIERLTAIRPPYTAAGIADINRRMLSRAADRAAVAAQWTLATDRGARLCRQCELPRSRAVPPFTFWDMSVILASAAIEASCLPALLRTLADSADRISAPQLLFLLALTLVAAFFFVRAAKRLLLDAAPFREMRHIAEALLAAFVELGLIDPSARLVASGSRADAVLTLSLANASAYEQSRFNAAVTELFSPIDNPRYLLVMKRWGRLSYRRSYACPAELGRTRENAACFAAQLRRRVGHFALIYTRTEAGRAAILRCRRRAFITQNDRLIHPKKRVVPWD